MCTPFTFKLTSYTLIVLTCVLYALLLIFDFSYMLVYNVDKTNLYCNIWL